VAGLLGELVELVADVGDGYAWSHNLAYGQSTDGRDGGGPVYVGKHNTPDPTGVAGTARENIRKAMVDAFDLLLDARSNLKAARGLVPPGPRPIVIGEARKSPRILEAVAAKQRREANGQGWGNG